MSISDVVSSLSKVQTFGPWSMHAVNDARLVLVNIHNDNIKLEARIAELTAEVERLKMSLAHIASMSDYMASDGYVQMYANSAIELPEPGLIARNALREGE